MIMSVDEYALLIKDLNLSDHDKESIEPLLQGITDALSYFKTVPEPVAPDDLPPIESTMKENCADRAHD